MFIFLILLFIMLNVADCVTTYAALKKFGMREANPVMAKLFGKVGVVGGLIIKMLVISALVIASCFIMVVLGGTTDVLNAIENIFLFVNILTVSVVINNIIQIWRVKNER